MISYSIFFLCQAYFTFHIVLQVHPCFCKWQDILLLWLSNILLHAQSCMHMLTHFFFICHWTFELFSYLDYCE